MSLSLEQMTGELTPEHDLFFTDKPQDPEMRESTSIWLYEENGEFGLPRIGIEAEAHSWENRGYQANVALGGGRILDGMGRGAACSPIGPDDRPTVLGAGPLVFRCLEPFRRWNMTFDGTAADGTVAQQIDKTLDRSRQVPVRVDVELEMVTPAWVQDNSPEKVAKMSKTEAADAASMGIGWRFEHLFRGAGTLEVDGKTREFRCVGNRIKRQSVRPLDAFRGHCWQAAVFPDGRAFGLCCYPASQDAGPYNDAYVFQDGKLHPARATRIPWLRELIDEGEDVSLELESALGTTRIEARSALSTYKIMGREDGLPVDFNLHQGGARYSWDGMSAYGMIERSATDEQMAAG